MEEIIQLRDNHQETRFDQLVEESIVLEIERPMDYDVFFKQVANVMAESGDISKDTLYQLLMEREKDLSTALRPDLAIPHIIIDGQNTFRMLLARSKPGIYFSDLAPKVHAVFVLMGTRDQRNHHLYVLSAIAEIVQQTQFQERWMKAKNETTLRNIARLRKAVR